METLGFGWPAAGFDGVEEGLGLARDLGWVAIREMPNDDVILGEGVTGGFGLEGHHTVPGIELAGNRLKAGR